MKEIFSIILAGYAVLMGLSILNVLLNLEAHKANYHNPHNPMQEFSFARVVGLKVVAVVVALVVASSLNPELFT